MDNVSEGSRVEQSVPPLDKASNGAQAGAQKASEVSEKQRHEKYGTRQRKEQREMRKLRKSQQKEASVLQGQATSDGTKKVVQQQRKKTVEDENAVDPDTPHGQKKLLSVQIAKKYKPRAVEKSWYAWWETMRYFTVDSTSTKPPFVMILPPSNVTGDLHIGHALTVAIEDAIIRWRRMSGYNALWIPGIDHGSLTTQVAVEEKLSRERKLTRHDIGREKFVSEVLEWKAGHSATISNQLRRLGASLDWSREDPKMDEQRSKAVTEAFVMLHNEGLIYRDDRIVNWDCSLQTAISDIEVQHINLKQETTLKVPGYADPVDFGVSVSFAYPIENGYDEIFVSTTRIETMLGDTAIAVHPKDDRYKRLHGRYAVHPFINRRLKIICDESVDSSLGNGAVKVTPAHDPNDFEIGKRHGLQFVNIFTDDGKINSNGGEFEGMPRFTARVAIIKALKEKGLYEDSKTKEICLGVCLRTNDVVEPMIKPQWFVKCNTMAKAGLDALRCKKIEIIPQQSQQDFYRCLENINDWCVSRQLWWGHPIPAWHVKLEDDQEKNLVFNCDAWIVARNESDAILEAQKKYPGKKFQLIQDSNVLDTWFSSCLFPLTVLGWPDNTPDLHAFYPTSVLDTENGNLLIWVARMVMIGVQLGDNVPFQKVYLHPSLCDTDDKEMTGPLEGLLKRLEGNLDPIELNIAKEGRKKDYPNGIAECGADALRFGLISYASECGRTKLDNYRFDVYPRWCSNLWNSFCVAMDNLGNSYIPPASVDVSQMPAICKWILSDLNKAVDKTVTSLEAYKLSDAASAVYSWWQYALCNRFLEAIKSYFSEDSEKHKSARAASRDTLWTCLDTGLRLLHPLMPYITEELWQRLPRRNDCCQANSIMISKYPSVVEDWNNDSLENEMGIVFNAAQKIKSLKPPRPPTVLNEMTCSSLALSEKKEKPPKVSNERLCAFARCRSQEIADIVQRHRYIIASLSSVSRVQILRGNDETPDSCAAAVVNKDLSVYLQFKGAVNVDAEREKLRKKRDEILKLQGTLTQKMGIPGYQENVPKIIQEEDMKKFNVSSQKLGVISEYEMLLDAIHVGESPDPVLSSEISALCKIESWPDMSQPGHAAPLTLDQGAQIEERFLAFLRGFKVNGHVFYRTVFSALKSMQTKELSINYKHLQIFDLRLANTVSMFFESVQKHLINAAKVFLEMIGTPYENLLVKICDLAPKSFLPLKEFWNLPGHHPSEEVDIHCGDTTLTVTKSTPAGRIPLYNLLRKLFGSFEKGNSWNGEWKIEDVMVDLETYQVEIIKSFCGHCNHHTMLNDVTRCATDIIPEFKCGGHLPAFFGHLQCSLSEFIPEQKLNPASWKKFQNFIIAHLSLKSSVTRSNFFDNLHEVLWTLGGKEKKILQTILNSGLFSGDWRDLLFTGEMGNPILDVVFEHNKKKKEKIAQERKADAGNEKRGGSKGGDTEEAQQVQAPAEANRDEQINTAAASKSGDTVEADAAAEAQEAQAPVEVDQDEQINVAAAASNGGDTVQADTAADAQQAQAPVEADQDEQINAAAAASNGNDTVLADTAADAQQAQAPVVAVHVIEAIDQDEMIQSGAAAALAEECLEKVVVFNPTREGLLIFSRHVKQHGSLGAKDAKGKQRLQKISEIDLVTSHYLEVLIEIVHALIYNINSEEVDLIDDKKVDCSSPEYKRVMVMIEEIFKEYNAPEAIPVPDSFFSRQDECDFFVVLEQREDSCHQQDIDHALTESSVTLQRVKAPVRSLGEHPAA